MRGAGFRGPRGAGSAATSLCDPAGVASPSELQLPHLPNEHDHVKFSGLTCSVPEMIHLTGLGVRLHSLRYNCEILFL